MAKKTIRDNKYYLDLLEREHSAVFRDYQAGKHHTVENALIAAGIKAKRTRLQEMLNAWTKATPAEQDAFRRAIGCAAPVATSPTPPAAAGPFAVARRLEPWAISALQGIMARRAMKIGNVMDELGRDPLNASVGRAIHRGDRLQQDLIDDLEAWVKKHSSP